MRQVSLAVTFLAWLCEGWRARTFNEESQSTSFAAIWKPLLSNREAHASLRYSRLKALEELLRSCDGAAAFHLHGVSKELPSGHSMPCLARAHRRQWAHSDLQMLARRSTAKKTKQKKAPAVSAFKGFGAPKRSKEEAELVEMGQKLASGTSSSLDPKAWIQWASAAANHEEYAEARMIMEAGIAQLGDVKGAQLIDALGQMRREGYATPELEAAAAEVEWPGKGDESSYDPSAHRFSRFDAPEWPQNCPRGTMYPDGSGAVVVSEDPIIDPSECAWVVEQAQRAADSTWLIDHGNRENIGADMIWSKPFPDRLWLREVPGLLDWFEHRLRTRLFPMLQSLYPEVIPSSDVLRCHDAFISRYDANGMNSLDFHQDTTDFTFTIGLNPRSDFEGGGTKLKDIRPSGSNEDFVDTVINPDAGCIASFCGKLFHGGNAITSGYRYIIPLFIYIDSNKMSKKPRGYLLEAAGIKPGRMVGLDAF